nr:MAG TPA: hypothetical protein [Caudoviricetes sp.]
MTNQSNQLLHDRQLLHNNNYIYKAKIKYYLSIYII